MKYFEVEKEVLAGDEISVEDASFDTTGYEMLPLDFCERGEIRSETYERANK